MESEASTPKRSARSPAGKQESGEGTFMFVDGAQYVGDFVAVGGKPVRDVAAVLAAVDDAEVGETVRVTVRRPAETLDIEVVAADLQTRTFDADAEAVPQASESKGGGAGGGGGGPLVAGGRGDRSGDAPGADVAAGAVAAAATKAQDALADELLLSILLVRGPPVPVLN